MFTLAPEQTSALYELKNWGCSALLDIFGLFQTEKNFAGNENNRPCSRKTFITLKFEFSNFKVFIELFYNLEKYKLSLSADIGCHNHGYA